MSKCTFTNVTFKLRISIMDSFMKNDFLQMSHSNSVCPLWICLCLIKQPDVVNVFSHMSHRNGLSPVWIHLCLDKLLEHENSFWHKQHKKVFVCVQAAENYQYHYHLIGIIIVIFNIIGIFLIYYLDHYQQYHHY